MTPLQVNGSWLFRSDGVYPDPGTEIDLLRVVDFNGLSNGQSVVDTVNDPGSTSGKRFDWTLGNKGFVNGYGIQATTSIKQEGKSSSCAVSIAEGSDGDPSGGGTGSGYGCWGGGVSLGVDAISEGQEFWYGERVLVPDGFNWNSGSGASKPGYIKFLRVNNNKNGQRLEHHVLNGAWAGGSYSGESQIGWTLANEFDPKSQVDTHKITKEIMSLGQWVWVEFYVLAHSDPSLAKRRIWVNDNLVFERVGANNKWVDGNGDTQTEVLSSGEKSLPSSDATLDSVMHGTYWNGYSPQDNTYYIQHIGYHKNGSDLIAVDQFGNKMIGSYAIV